MDLSLGQELSKRPSERESSLLRYGAGSAFARVKLELLAHLGHSVEAKAQAGVPARKTHEKLPLAQVRRPTSLHSVLWEPARLAQRHRHFYQKANPQPGLPQPPSARL